MEMNYNVDNFNWLGFLSAMQKNWNSTKELHSTEFAEQVTWSSLAVLLVSLTVALSFYTFESSVQVLTFDHYRLTQLHHAEEMTC